MNVSRGFALASLMAVASLTTLAASPAFAQFSLSDAANAVTAMQGNEDDESDESDESEDAVAALPKAAGLLTSLGSQLNVTPEQALGGAGAMLGLARNQLSGQDFTELSKNVPGLDQIAGNSALSGLSGLGGLGGLLGGGVDKNPLLNGLLGNVKDTKDLNNAFSALGMDTGMIGLFAPVILQYLGQQGVAGSLLQNLGGIWGTGIGTGIGS
ncbi:Protein of unknown function VcgC/VcgE (DUF2780) [Pseudomonas sp. GM79]|uniref:DUF2780 domain-containing protein n=1 Tax=Pseudomonas sp. GM79 TaxID=1144338 RepID=UPI00026F50F3|nr:DUF2780 domain-containing protein [Pseudomonas sp. GM79]EJN16722.1 Protein of unknown function VcgC/VcgE (DUF2780) [Pseudomonas sp. GM79]